MSRPVIFLDFDGVLITKQCYVDRRPRHAKAKPRCVEALNTLLADTRADIVVSSSWRGDTIRPMQRQLEQWGVYSRVVGVTPCYAKLLPSGLWMTTTRACEIQAWMADHWHWEPYCILDDEDDGLSAGFRDAYIRTTFDDGLTMAHVHAAIQLLSR